MPLPVSPTSCWALSLAEISREEFAAIQGRWLAADTLDGPVLLFSADDQADADWWRQRLLDARVAYRKAFKVEARQEAGQALRQAHRGLVGLSVGFYNVGDISDLTGGPWAQVWPGFFELPW